METLARVGFAVKGILYLLLGASAVAFGLRIGGRVSTTQEAIVGLLSAPGGRLLVGLIAAGLAFYATWRFLEAFADANRKGSHTRALATRAAMYGVSGAVYGVLAFDAARLAVARPGSDGEFALPATVVGSALAQPAAMLLALGIGAYGAMQLMRAFSAKLSDQLNLRRVQREIGAWPVRVSRIGIGGRGVVLMVMAFVLFRRAMSSAAAAATTDSADSLRLLAALPSGRWLLALVAAGLMGYGVFQLVQARYRTITAP